MMEMAGLGKAFGCSFARKDEFLSQSVLQPDIVPLLSRHSAIPIVHTAVEFSVEFEERAFSGGNKKGKINARQIAKRRQIAVRVKGANRCDSTLKLFLFKCSTSCLVSDPNQLAAMWPNDTVPSPKGQLSLILETLQPDDNAPGSSMQLQDGCQERCWAMEG